MERFPVYIVHISKFWQTNTIQLGQILKISMSFSIFSRYEPIEYIVYMLIHFDWMIQMIIWKSLTEHFEAMGLFERSVEPSQILKLSLMIMIYTQTEFLDYTRFSFLFATHIDYMEHVCFLDFQKQTILDLEIAVTIVRCL